jgi:8-oxoguanine deaminase
VQLRRARERAAFPRGLGDPRRVLESESDRRDERRAIRRAERGDARHRGTDSIRTLLLRHATLVATFDDAGREIPDGAVLLRGNVVEAVGPTAELTAQADEVIDARGLVLLPGLVCTHHHFYQTLTRNLPQAQDAELFDWLVAHYPIWARLTPEAVRASTATATAELLLSGCTTAADHGYIWPNGARVDDQIAVAREMGLRFHASRGSMSRGRSQGGLPPDEAVEDEDAILHDTERVIREHHDPSRYAMTRIVVAPCSPFSVTPDLMRASAELARKHDHVHLHTHLCETADEEKYCLDQYGKRPVELAESLGWTGGDVWFAHAIHMRRDEFERLGKKRTGVAHCPTSNMRLGSGVAPVLAQRDAGMRVGLGVDGSASNDGSHMLDEARHAMLLQRVAHGAAAMTAREALRLATRGGAAVVGRDDIGHLAPGMAADLIGIRADDLFTAGGSIHDPLSSLIFCRIPNADLSIVDGAIRVRDGRLVAVDVPALIERHERASRALTAAT